MRAQTDNALGNRHIPGRSDELGDRVVILDERGMPSLELLRFRRTLTTIPGFEVSLRRRIERLRQFKHPAFATTPAVEYLGEDRGLALLSPHVVGRRLSDLIDDARGGVFASALIRQLTPALSAFHQFGDGIGHGALTANRILVSPSGQLIIVEHALGSALERLQLTAPAMHEALGLRVPADGTASRPRIDARTDFFQLGLIALSLLLGRPLTAGESEDNLEVVFDRAFAAADLTSEDEWHGLRTWLELALQFTGRAFPSSEDACAALRDVGDPTTDPAEPWRALFEARHDYPSDLVHSGDLVHSSNLVHSSSLVQSSHLVEPSPLMVDLGPLVPEAQGLLLESQVPAEPMPESSAIDAVQEPESPVLVPAAAVERDHHAANAVPAVFAKPPRYLHWAVALLALVAVAQSFALATLLRGRSDAPPPAGLAEVTLDTPHPGAIVEVDGESAGVTPLQLKIGPETRTISIASPLLPEPEQAGVVGSTGQQPRLVDSGRGTIPSARSTSVAPTPQPFGGIRFSSPIALDVFEGEARLGSSASGIVSAPAGRHELDLVNSVLGFRSRQVVNIRGGQVVSLTVSPPNGRININAVPWAEVLIDGKPVGETPIGNLSIPLGEHEIILRHPQLGEVRRTALVRSDAVTRVTANLER